MGREIKTFDVPEKFKNIGFSITKGEVVQLKTRKLNIKPSNERLNIVYYSNGEVYQNGELNKDFN